MIEFISLAKRLEMHKGEIQEAVERVVASGWYLLGDELARFESAYADYIHSKHCVGVGNGLDALTLIYKAYIEMGRLAPGDEVIVPANTYIASMLALTANGLVPVLVEPDPGTLQIDGNLIERHITPRTRSVMIVHLFGRCAYTHQIAETCRRHGLLLVEDNAQAHGCRFENRMTGSLGDAAGHSFYPTKNLGALGDAGAVTTDDDELAAVVRSLRNYGSSSKNVFDYEGRNSRMDEIQAAVLNVRLAHLDEENAIRRSHAHCYDTLIAHPMVHLPEPMPSGSDVWHVYPVFCDRRDALQAFLREQGVETQVHYPIPPHRQRCYAGWGQYDLPVTERLHATELSLPIGPELSLEQIAHVAKVLNEFPG